MNFLAELLPKGLLQGTDRQASVITAFIPPDSAQRQPGCRSEPDPRF